MGALASIITAISDDVVAALAAAGYPPLTPDQSGGAGKILVGTAAAYEQTSPPRIIFEPKGSKFTPAEWSSSSATLSTQERKAQSKLRSIATEQISFTVRCWGAAGTSSPVDDYDVTRALYHRVRASIHALIPGAYEIAETGTFTTGTNVVRDGREFVFGVTFFTPVLDSLLPYDLPNQTEAVRDAAVAYVSAPVDVEPAGGLTMTTPSGTEGP